jgi:hypothetical protein
MLTSFDDKWHADFENKHVPKRTVRKMKIKIKFQSRTPGHLESTDLVSKSRVMTYRRTTYRDFSNVGS